MGSFCNPFTRVQEATLMVAELQPDEYNSKGALFNFFLESWREFRFLWFIIITVNKEKLGKMNIRKVCSLVLI